MANAPKDIIDASDLIKAAWKKYAATAMFAGMTEAQYEAAVKPAYDVRGQISDHETAITQLISDRDLLDGPTNKINQQVIKAMVGDVNYGDDSDLYGACGYVRKSEMQSGLTRKNIAAAKAAAAKKSAG